MSEQDVWLTIGLLLISTLITRCGVFVIADRLRLPPRVQHALRYAPAAAMAAIVLPDLLLLPGGGVDFGWHNLKLLAGLGALLFFTLTRHMLGMIIAGMALFTVLRILTT
jgi:branched-subunit amino acid transport protein